MFVYFLSRESSNLLLRTVTLFYIPNMLGGFLIVQMVICWFAKTEEPWLEPGSYKWYWSDKNRI